MAILAECPGCHSKQASWHKKCPCGEDLDRAKQSKRVRYWIQYRVPGGRQRREFVGLSIQEARAADGKRKAQKREGRIFEMLPEARMTFTEMTDWYQELSSVKSLASYPRVKLALSNFNRVFGTWKVNAIKPVDIEEYQQRREKEGKAPATIDMEISIVKTMITKAFDNDLANGHTVKAFRKVKRRLRKAANARKRTVSVAEYLKLRKAASPHLQEILTVAYSTGMRSGELRALLWSHIDMEKGVIRLPADVTKERKGKIVPMNHHVRTVLAGMPTPIRPDLDLFVFTFRGKPIKDPGGLKKSFKTACKNAGIPCGRKVPDGITFHDLRRSVKTNMVKAGVDKVYRDLILGHSLQGMDVHYMAPAETDLQGAMDLYTRWLDSETKMVRKGQEQIGVG